MPQANDQLGPYTLMRRLGRGAFGEVWLAERRTPLATTLVAVKLVVDEHPDLKAISQESRVWAEAAGHPNILPIIEADVYDGYVVIVSEYASDGSLQDWLERHGKTAPSIEAAVAMTAGILSGLEHLHSKRIIHRDLKPGNILLQGETPRLADFGLARMLKSTPSSSGIAGTPSYMSPETFDGKRSERSDIWSVGVILYQLLSGRRPFPQLMVAELVGAILNRPFDPLPPTVPLPLRQVVARALQKDPTKRFQTASEMRVMLLDAMAGPSLVRSKNQDDIPTETSVTFQPTGTGLARPRTLPTQGGTLGNRGVATAPQSTVATIPVPVPSTVATASNRSRRVALALVAAAAVGLAGFAAARGLSGSSTAERANAPVRTSAVPDVDEERSWALVKDGTDKDQLRSFLERYPDGPHSGEAAVKLAQLLNTPAGALPSNGSTQTDSAQSGWLHAADQSATSTEPATQQPQPVAAQPQTPQSVVSSAPAPSQSAQRSVGGEWEDVDGPCPGSRTSIVMSGSQIVAVSGTKRCKNENHQWTGYGVSWNPSGSLAFTMDFGGGPVAYSVQFISDTEAIKQFQNVQQGWKGSARMRKVG
jgi:serine/threonine protein kinase